MNTIVDLFTQYSIETIILFIVILAFSLKALGELWEWFYTKFHKHFNFENQKDQDHKEILKGISEIKEQISAIQGDIGKLDTRVKSLEIQSELTCERLQENSRAYIIDKHHMYCYEIRAIDDLNLQSLERRYLYYKAAGGNSFIDGLMEEIRSLPRINPQDPRVINAINDERGEV